MEVAQALPECTWVADACLRVAFAEMSSEAALQRVRAAFVALEGARLSGVVDVVSAYATVLVTFHPRTLDPARAEREVKTALATAARASVAPGPVRTVPTCYEGACAPDLEEVARLHGLAREEVVALHTSADYVVAFLGFAPGFPYLAGLPASLSTPRLERPRLRVPAGSVAIAGLQAGIYPQATPGGWRLLGRTPLSLFQPDRKPPALFGVGDRVRFVAIAHGEHERALGR